jgi:Ca-activated chloride channel family protein
VKSFGKTRKGGILAVLLGILATVIWVQVEAGAFTRFTHVQGIEPQVNVHPKTGVKFQASLSHPMIVQGADGTVYLNDRSGSMAEDNKWAFATQAVHTLLDRLTPSDRIALITFDTSARVQSRLIPASETNIRRFRNIVNSLHPGDSTNMGDALLRAEGMSASARVSERGRRVILLSDGHANVGIVHPGELAAMARRIADNGSVLSTVGMGLGFNETLMASLADHGMGSFSYLEHLESLGTVLAQELDDSRDIYADGSEMRIVLPHGVELVDAAGYPFEREGRTVVIRTGQLFQESTKTFMATLSVANHVPAEYVLGDIDLSYRVDGRSYQQEVGSSRLSIACVAPERKTEAVASIDKDLYRSAWIKNNLGSIMREVGDYVRSGDQEKAKELMDNYRDRLEEADAAVPGLKKDADRQLDELEARVDDAFQGPDQKVKQNRAAKSFLGASQELQRETNRNTN